jgi:starch-binding outer membrane protein, SusD/RagB family
MLSKKIIAAAFVLSGCILSSCKKDFQPDKDNHSVESRLLKDPAFAEGLLLNAYAALPNAYSLEETATDDAATNDKASSFLRMATGEWTSQFNPLTIWDHAYRQIYYLNHFLSIAHQVTYSWDERLAPTKERNQMFAERFTGEASALRAWYYFELLQRHGGIAEDGTPRGFVIVKNVISRDSDWNLPRDTYDECVKFILADIDTAVKYLPNVYANQGTDVNHNLVFGAQNKNRVTALFAKALKSRVLLHVASQPFVNDAAKWEKAANAAAALVTYHGGVNGLSSTGVNFWRNLNDKEILFRRDFQTINSWEVANFPPSLFGNGQTNPSQNLVDAFPMANGYPITAAQASYNLANPYASRDPRLKAYILYNGNDLNGKVVNTNMESPKDGLNQTIQSTRTGYYLKKLLVPTVNLNPNTMSTQQHFYTLFRYTEQYLIYAEAANEAWGPTADPNGHGFTATQLIGAIRKRGGITQPDNYLATVSTSQDDMRQLIRNERRIELSFEGFRFWDLRRWNLSMTEPVKGMSIANGQHAVINVEDRLYQPHMKFGPIPYQETLKASKVIQNSGW